MATHLVQLGVQILTGAKHKVGSGPGFVEPVYIAQGTGAGTTATTDTTLFTEATYTNYARVTGTATLVTTSFTNDTWKLVGTQTNNSGTSQTITNAGNFDATSAGNLDIKSDFTGITLANLDAIQYTITEQCQVV